MKNSVLTFVSALALSFALSGSAQAGQAGQVDRLYVIDCGWAHATDQSRWSPGVNAGVPIDFADNCYLIHHSTQGYVLWDTGITDRLIALPEGREVPALGQTWHRSQTLLASLAAIGVKPEDITYVAISHWHPDHTGNLDEFPGATVVMQKAEWNYAMSLPQKPFSAEHKTELLEGDTDLFGDGSLAKSGYVILSGDVVHFQSNWDSRRVPSDNADQNASRQSMDKIARVMREKHAQLWINHDKASSDSRKHAPEFYE